MTVDAALAIAAKGWRVFPCEGKKALVPWQRLATTNERAVRQLFRRHPDANVGIALPTGTVVIDVDDRAAFEASGLVLPEAPGQQTPSGGYHRLFSTNGHAVAQTVKDIPGADTRVGGKGYIVAWEPDALPNADGLPAAPEWVYLQRTVKRVRVPAPDDRIPKSQRNSTLTSLAGSMRDRGMTEDAMFAALKVENDSRCDPPLSDRDVRTIARSVARYAPHNAPEAEPEDDELQDKLGLRAMADVRRIEPQPLLLDRYQPDGPTVLFGPGGIGKADCRRRTPRRSPEPMARSFSSTTRTTSRSGATGSKNAAPSYRGSTESHRTPRRGAGRAARSPPMPP